MATNLTVVVQSGGSPAMPLSGVQVKICNLAAGGAVIGDGTSDAGGRVVFSWPSTMGPGLYSATADRGGGVVLMALLGQTLPNTAVINELTTVAGAYCAAQFIANGQISGPPLGLRIAVGMNENLVNIADGTVSGVLTSPPNGAQTISRQVLASLGCMVAACVRIGGKALSDFLTWTTPPYGEEPTDTVAALANLARNPANHAGPLYYLSKAPEAQVYGQGVTSLPDGWTLVVKVNNSGSDSRLFGGPAIACFDPNGYAWIPNNVDQGTPASCNYAIVLDMTGRPAPFSPLMGGGLLGGGFGVAVRNNSEAWLSDFGWGGSDYWPEGTVSVFDLQGQPQAANGYTKYLHRVQGIAIDQSNNVWMSSYQNGRVVMYPNGEEAGALLHQGDPETFKPFGVAIAADGTAWVTNSNTSTSGLFHLKAGGKGLEVLGQTSIGRTNKGVAIDSNGVIWMGSGGDDHVYAFSANGQLIGGYQGGGMWGPWGLALDGDDNVWVANFGPLEVGNVFTGRLTQLAGSRATHKRMGDGMTPQAGLTLPSGGAPVTLPDASGSPLYGPGAPDCYIPMMRTTGVSIDAAGNVWSANNWKPDFTLSAVDDPFTNTDPGTPQGNPGGDGMLIWVGLATPPR